MVDQVFESLKKTGVGKKIKNLGYLPRWIIFMLDLVIVLISSVVTYVIISSLVGDYYDHVNIVLRAILIIVVNSTFFLLFKTYSGIIRHSTFIDAVKLLFATSSAYVTFVIINYVIFYLFQFKIFLTTGLFITYVISFLNLFLFRIIVKFFFDRYLNFEEEKKLIRAVIYGADSNAISVANAIHTDNPKRFKLIGFVDKYHSNKTSKSILALPIINQNRKIHVHLRVLKADALIIAEKGLSKEEISLIVEECLEHNLKIYTVPLIADWEDKSQISNNIKSFQIEDLLERKPIVLNTTSIKNQLSKKTILITGAAGSIGSEITRQVLKFNPSRIIILDQAETPLHDLSLEVVTFKKKIKIKSVLADIRDSEQLEKIFQKYQPDVVYHAAAYKHVPLIEENPSQAIFTNVMGTKNLADLSVKYKVQRFVMVSTDKAVNPSSVMGASKRIAEKYVQTLHDTHKGNDETTKFITTRFGNVLGSNGSVVPLFTKQIQEGGPITITHPEIIRYFMTIPEACQLVLEAGAMGNGGEIFIFDMGKPVKIIDLARKMIRLAGFTPDKDIEIRIVGLRPGEKLFEELLHDTSKTLPTHHEKILISVEMNEDHEHIKNAVIELIERLQMINNDEVVFKMKKIVPEFKSMNSVFEILDGQLD